ncbi:MAG: hypothetical protein RBR82_15435 [Pseudomonas sp.]|nr:hypothetical protein [Pseudomonas sp.]
MFQLARIAFALALLFAYSSFNSPPETYSQAKVILKERINYDQNKNGALGTIYYDCD